MRAVTSTRRLTRPLSVAAIVIVFLGFKLSTGDREPASQLVSRGAGTVVKTVPIGEAFVYRATIANTSDEPIQLLQVQPLTRAGLTVHSAVGSGETVPAGGELELELVLVVEAPGTQLMETVEFPYVQGGKERSVRMPFKLVACAEPATTCEIPSDWDG